MELELRKDFGFEDGKPLFRWIALGPAGAIEVYVRHGDKTRAEIHRHAFLHDPESSAAERTDCDVLPGGRCSFMAWWDAAAREVWGRVLGGDDEAPWAFLEHAYEREFNVTICRPAPIGIPGLYPTSTTSDCEAVATEKEAGGS